MNQILIAIKGRTAVQIVHRGLRNWDRQSSIISSPQSIGLSCGVSILADMKDKEDAKKIARLNAIKIDGIYKVSYDAKHKATYTLIEN